MRAVLLLLGLAVFPASAEVYRCVTPEGRTLYRDSPCPRGSTAANITIDVGGCATPECLANRERLAAAARERLRQEKETLAAMTAERRKAEAEALAERVKLAELARLTAIDERLAAEVQFAAQPSLAYPAYPWYPVVPCNPPCGVRPPCLHPHGHFRPGSFREPSVSLRNPNKQPR